jgi:uncharacterized membrane protein YeaQ/YmgE (transglycosylase-associated protein family)
LYSAAFRKFDQTLGRVAFSREKKCALSYTLLGLYYRRLGLGFSEGNSEDTMQLENLVIWIVIGGLAGLLADALISGVKLGLASAVIVGILGAFVGGWLFSVLNISVGAGLVGHFVSALVGAIALLAILRALKYR